MRMLVDILSSIERSGLGEAIRTTPYLYPILMSLHVVGISILVGPALVVDLRSLGIARKVVPVTVTTRYLLPVCHIGFAVVLCTGIEMFVAIAMAVGESPAARWKFGLIAIAGINIAVFHKGIYRTVEKWDFDASPPTPAKLAAKVSALSWTGVIFAGRFLAY